MSKIENAIAVPIRHYVHPIQLAIGGAVALSGFAILLGRLLPVL